MTKQARFQLTHITLPYAIQMAVSRSNFGDKFRQFKRGQITQRELDTCLREAYTVSARLGKNEQPLHCPRREEKPLHCPRRTTDRNKPTRNRNRY